MAAEKEETIQKEAGEPLPADSELFAGEVREELTEKDVFVGDETFYKSLAEPASKPASPAAAGPESTPDTTAETNQPQPSHIVLRQFSASQKALVAGIIVIAMTLIYVLLKPAPIVVTVPMPNHTAVPQQHVQGQPKQAGKPEQPLSLEMAETLYAKKEYSKAYDLYEKLGQKLAVSASKEIMRDFLQLRMALCLEKTDDYNGSIGLYEAVSRSVSPIIRVVANYHLGVLEIQNKPSATGLQAQSRVYQAIALTDVVDFSREQALSFQRNCYFLAAEAATKEVLTLSNTDKGLPKSLWFGDEGGNEPFDGLTESQIRSLLNCGLAQMDKASLGPQIQRLERQDVTPRWSVVCNGASIEEFLARFAANADVDIYWAVSDESRQIGEQVPARKRPVSLYLRDSSAQQVISVAAGAAGLSTSFSTAGDPDGIGAGRLKATISNLTIYSALAEHISSVNDEAVSLWHKFILTFGEDRCSANAHFALGLLREQKGQITDAISEYKLVANRYSQNPVASFALLRSGKLRADLRNYAEARTDLKQLVEQYPDSPVTSQAILYLADATMKAGLYDEAIRLYSKVYNLNISLESQASAALGTAKCFYDRKEYGDTAKWLGRYIGAVNDPKAPELPAAYLMLGKTDMALGRLPQACDAFKHALARNLPLEKSAEAESALAEIQIEQGNFVEALGNLEGINPERFSQKDAVGITLLKSKALRLMGLPDNAIAVLGEKTEYVTEPQLKARASLELARCYIAKGDLQLGQRSLAETLAIAEPGPLAQEISAELAEVCLKVGQKEQAMSLCSKLLESNPPAGIRQKAMDIMAVIYRQQKDYDRAAAILIGEWNGQK